MLDAVGMSGVPVGVSFGVAVYPQDGKTSAMLVKSADAALYAAKRAGRGRIVFASPLP